MQVIEIQHPRYVGARIGIHNPKGEKVGTVGRLKNVEYLSLNARQLALSLLESDKRFFIDSYMQHAAASFGLPSNVIWIANTPKTLGSSIHNNIECDFESGSLRNSMYEPYDILGDPIQLATPPSVLVDSEKIIKLLK